MKPGLFFIVFFVLLSHLSPSRLYSQDTLKQTPDGTTGLFLTIREWDSIRLKSLPANEFEGAYSSFRIGLGYIHDFTTYAQSKVFKEQMDSLKLSLGPTFKLRDFRILGSGVLKTKRPISWKFAYMWDGDKKIWMARESGLTIEVPKLSGHIFIGRTKEGYSMVKVMNGHSGVTNERQMALDPIPILADGIKWFGYKPKSRIFWNLGAFSDLTSKGQGFATFEWQFVARGGWMPLYDNANNKLIHIATNLRYGKPLNGKFTVKSRPQSNPTPHLINTGEFQTDHSSSIGAEIFYSNNSLSLGSEFMVHNFYSEKFEDHHFFGGDFIASYFFTGAKRPYKTVGSIYGFVPVKKSVFKGGLGEIEGVLHASTFDLNDGSIQGGQFWRITPMVNWYLSKAIRLELIYGYGVLDRFQKKGAVHFFESRFQLTAM